MKESSNHNIIILIFILYVGVCSSGCMYVCRHVEAEANLRYCPINCNLRYAVKYDYMNLPTSSSNYSSYTQSVPSQLIIFFFFL